MRTAVIITIALLLLAASRALTAPLEAITATQRLIVRIAALTADETRRAEGLGFLVAPTLIACDTAVIDAGRMYDVYTHDDRLLEIEGTIRMDAGLESVLLRPLWPQERIQEVPLVQDVVTPGEALTIVTLKDPVPCTVADVAKVDERITITLTADIDAKSTGAPVLNQSGAIVGMLALRGSGSSRTAALIPGKALELIRSSAPPTITRIESPDASSGQFRTLASTIPAVVREETPPPSDILSRLSSSHQTLMREQSRWYIRSPDGRCFNAYRILRHLELLEKPPTFGRELEQFAGPMDLNAKPDSDEKVVHEETPDWWESENDLVIATGKAPHASVFVRKKLAENLWTADIVGPAAQIYNALLVDPSGLCTAPEAPINEPVVAIATGNAEFHGRVWRSFELFRLADLKPTPAQLAWSVCQQKATIVIHTVRTSEHQPKRTIRTTGNYASYRKVVNDGPRIVTHRWKAVAVPVRFRPVQASSPQ